MALLLQDCFPVGLSGLCPAEDLESLLRGDCIGEVTEVDGPDELLGAHVRDQLPDRLARLLGAEVPDGIDDGTRGEVDGTLVRSDPAQLAVSRELAPEPAGVFLDPLQVEPDHEVSHRLNGGTADVIAAADREGEAVARQIWIVGLEDTTT